MSETPPEDPTPPRAAFTLDLSSGKSAAKQKRPKGFVPVVQQTINLTRKKTEAPRTEAPVPSEPTRKPAARPPDARRSDPPPASNPRTDGPRRDDGYSRPPGGTRPSGGTGLADFLDEATLARLRGGA